MTTQTDLDSFGELLDYCAQKTALDYFPQEKKPLTRRLKQFLDQASEPTKEDIVEQYEIILPRLRRLSWRQTLTQHLSKTGQNWFAKGFVDEVIDDIQAPQTKQDDLIALFDDKIHKNLQQSFDTAQTAFESITEGAGGDGQHINKKDILGLLKALQGAFNLPPKACEALFQEFNAKQKAERKHKAKAEIKRQKEDAKLRAWEESLVTFHEIPRILRASKKEIINWVLEQRIPVARKTFTKKGKENWEFDPQLLLTLRKQIPYWRKNTSVPKKGKSPKEEVQPDMGRGVANAVLARIAGMDEYAAHFAMARAIKRRITVVTGPTNSGKSHIALEALSQAPTGIALAPLRLLAHEFRDTLAMHKIPSSLYTGEERIEDPQASHVCATVEMCQFSKAFDVALIDEAQMLLDPDRGAAWTAALMGVPANHIYVLGAPDCIPMVKRIAKLCDEPIDFISLERKTPLQAANKPVSLSQIRKGDAIVAFSRREVLNLRALLVEHGHRVSVVYGALSPEVRKAEAACFNNGKSDVLVATDAIGMGLNLSIRRVIFAALQKYDGRDMRDLTPQEVKQIGGRAGRYGLHEKGIVTVLKGCGNVGFIKHMLDAPPLLPEDMRPFVQPDLSIVKTISKEIHTDSLYGVLARIYRAVLRKDDPNYRLADMQQAFEIASELEGIDGLDLDTRWSYAMCPIDERNNGIQRLMDWARNHAQNKTIPAPKPGFLPRATHATNRDLEKAEKRYKVLLAWRWLALRFPEIYEKQEEAINNVRHLNGWIERVLRRQSTARNQKGKKGNKGKHYPKTQHVARKKLKKGFHKKKFTRASQF